MKKPLFFFYIAAVDGVAWVVKPRLSKPLFAVNSNNKKPFFKAVVFSHQKCVTEALPM